MAKMRSADAITAKWSRRAQQSTDDYKAGVTDPNVQWARAAEASKESYREGVTDAINRGAFEKGVVKAGDEKWRRKTEELGAGRWAPGVRAGEAAMRSGTEANLKVIEAVVPPPRAPRGDPRNLARVEAYATALSNARRRG